MATLNADRGTRRPTRKGGRKKGVPNKITTKVRTDIIEAYDKLGGVKYLVDLGKREPKTFAMLLAKILPKEVVVDAPSPIIAQIRNVVVKPGELKK